jgi:hypothetical protein
MIARPLGCRYVQAMAGAVIQLQNADNDAGIVCRSRVRASPRGRIPGGGAGYLRRDRSRLPVNVATAPAVQCTVQCTLLNHRLTLR